MNNPHLTHDADADALRHLESSGFDVKALWSELSRRLSAWDRGMPDDDDRRYPLPTAAPDLVVHLAAGRNAVLTSAMLWKGYSYTLSPGQRAWLRDNYDLTPTETVTVMWIETWTGDDARFPRSLCLKSDLHVPSNRRHVLTQAVIRNVGRFFRESAERDAQETVTSARRELAPDLLVVGKVYNLSSEEKWAVEDLCGVKVTQKCELVRSDATHITLVCHKNGNTARVEKEAFFATVAEYERLYATTKRTKPASFGPTPAIDDILKSMGVAP